MKDLLGNTKKQCIELGKSEGEERVSLAEIDMLNEYLLTQANIAYLSAYSEAIHEQAMLDFETYGEKEVLKYNRKIQMREVGAKYDFSNCNYPAFEGIEKAIKRDTEHLNQMKKTLKTLTKKTVIVDDDTGEAFEVKPPIKTSTTKLIIT